MTNDLKGLALAISSDLGTVKTLHRRTIKFPQRLVGLLASFEGRNPGQEDTTLQRPWLLRTVIIRVGTGVSKVNRCCGVQHRFHLITLAMSWTTGDSIAGTQQAGLGLALKQEETTILVFFHE